MIKEYDVIKAKKDLSDTILKGCKGAVVIVYQEPVLGYEVEFIDSEGNTLDVLTVYPDDIEPLK
ncbi:DUF4926 domain-containing protein [Pectobacterium peruviense]|uniref:DUF4926 domain-containing protein n=1 Tax=Pectobacterium peruviense TaxID=2066479 RepID=UPI000DE57A31|nr:DUF4926 domain-containing protein [Pectobacterium peruviense]